MWRHLLNYLTYVPNVVSMWQSSTLIVITFGKKRLTLPQNIHHLNHTESWAPKNQCLWTVVLEKTLESPLDCKEIQPVHSKGNQSWIFIGRTDAEVEAPILWPPDVKNWLTEIRPWCWERLKAEGEGDDRGWDGWMASLAQCTWVWASSRRWWWDGEAWYVVVHGVAKGWTWLSDWTELNIYWTHTYWLHWLIFLFNLTSICLTFHISTEYLFKLLDLYRSSKSESHSVVSDSLWCYRL